MYGLACVSWALLLHSHANLEKSDKAGKEEKPATFLVRYTQWEVLGAGGHLLPFQGMFVTAEGQTVRGDPNNVLTDLLPEGHPGRLGTFFSVTVNSLPGKKLRIDVTLERSFPGEKTTSCGEPNPPVRICTQKVRTVEHIDAGQEVSVSLEEVGGGKLAPSLKVQVWPNGAVTIR